ncbi:MAG: hypothetical protein ACI9W6_000142 [Motiliproteus sp.]|jgi:hypothetical protein
MIFLSRAPGLNDQQGEMKLNCLQQGWQEPG